MLHSDRSVFFHAGWKMHRLDRRTQAGESGVYPFPFIHAFVVLMFINSMPGLRVEGVCVCGLDARALWWG